MRHGILIAFFVTSLGALASGQTSGDGQSTPATNPPSAVSAPAQTATPAPDPAAPPKKKAKHVYTTEDMKPADQKEIPSGNSSSGSSGDATSTAANADGKDDKTGKGKKDKKADPNAIAAQQAKVEELKRQVAGLDSAIKNTERLIAEGGEFRRQNMAEGLSKMQTDLTVAQKQKADAEAQLQAMQSPK